VYFVSAPSRRGLRRAPRLPAGWLSAVLLTNAILQAQTGPVPADPAAEFVQLTADIDILSWGGGLGGTEGPRPQTFQIHAVAGRNKWVISNQIGTTNRYTFDGTRIVERSWIDGGSSVQDPNATKPSAHWWTRSAESPDGNPGETIRVLDHLDTVSRIAWLAFCSGPTFNHPSRKIYPPWDLWKEYLDPTTFVEKTTRFEDDLGLPKTLLLFSGEHQPVVDYRVSATTNLAGWNFPQSFFLLEYNPTGTKGWMLGIIAHGRVSSIGPAADPFPPDTATLPPQPHGIRFTPVSPSKMHLEGTSDVHDWSLDTTKVVGFLELDQRLLDPANSQTSLPGDLRARAEFFFPVRHLCSGYSAPMFSYQADQAVLHQALKTTENPNIVYRLHHLAATHAHQPEASDLVLQATGEVVIGGVTNPISIPVHVSRQEDALKLSGSASIKLSDFGIEPPSAIGKDWVVKVGNTVQSSFELQLKPVEPQ
jgi:YceI-like domain